MNNKLITAANNHIRKYTIWKEKRLYIKDCNQTMIYNTRKCQQNVYIDLSTFTVHCYTDCPAQSNKWCDNENQRVIDALQSIARLLRIVSGAERGLAIQSVETVMNNAILDVEEVQGYYTEWRHIRVAINRFGKLAERNRQFVVPFKGTKNTAPRGFVPLSDAGYALLQHRAGTEGEMLEPYANPIDYNTLAIAISETEKAAHN